MKSDLERLPLKLYMEGTKPTFFFWILVTFISDLKDSSKYFCTLLNLVLFVKLQLKL